MPMSRGDSGEYTALIKSVSLALLIHLIPITINMNSVVGQHHVRQGRARLGSGDRGKRFVNQERLCRVESRKKD